MSEQIKRNDSNGKIESLQALRAVAFLGIFLSHAGFVIKWPKLGVSVFFVLSGFLLVIGYINKELNCGIKDCFFFSFNKIKRLYPLHLITMVLAILHDIYIFYRFGYNKDSIILLFKEIGLNLTLTQSWYPDIIVNSSLNGVAWYLSTITFLYFIFPVILKFIKKANIPVLWIMTLIMLVSEIGVVALLQHFGMTNTIWFVYCFPVFRVGDLFAGCCLGKTFLKVKEHNMGIVLASFLEIMATSLTVAIFVWLKVPQSSNLLVALQNWTTIYIPLALIWVYLFSKSEGIITKLISNKLFIYVGNISAYAFLIHYVITQDTLILSGLLRIELVGKKLYVIVLSELIATVIISVMYKKIENIVRNKKRQSV